MPSFQRVCGLGLWVSSGGWNRIRFARRVTVLILAFSVASPSLDWVESTSAWAQFSSGRQRDSIFKRKRGSSGGSSREQSPPAQYQPPGGQAVPQEPGVSEPPTSPPLVPAPPQTSPQPGAPPPGATTPPAIPGQVPRVRPRPGQPQQPGAPQGQQEAPKAGIPPEGHITLRLVPVDQKADVGQEFPVHVYLDNPKQKAFDVVSFALSYDPKLLEFVDAPGGEPGEHNSHDRSEKIQGGIALTRDDREDPFYLNRADPTEGMVYYRARCASGETTVGQGFLLAMKFRALQPILHTGLRFRFSEWPEQLAPREQSDQSWTWPKTMTFVAKSPSSSVGPGKWENLLGSEGTEADGVISGGLTVQGDHLQALAEEEENAPKGETGSRIVLEPRVAVVQSGKTLDINIRLFNPKEVPWDRIRFDLEFDPRYLTVEDQDSGNWISRGVNLLDGPYHDRFPFEWMRNNLVRQKEGRILYECGVLTKPLRVDGIVATLRLRALRPVPETKVSFRVPGEVTWRDGTVLTRRRADRLGNTDDPQDGVGGTIISIVPRRASEGDGSLADVRAN